MKTRTCQLCGHEHCMTCLRLTWQTFIPATGPSLVCCYCRSNQIERVPGNGRVDNGDRLLAQPRSKRFRYPAETDAELLFSWPPDTEKEMQEISKSIKGGDGNGE